MPIICKLWNDETKRRQENAGKNHARSLITSQPSRHHYAMKLVPHCKSAPMSNDKSLQLIAVLGVYAILSFPCQLKGKKNWNPWKDHEKPLDLGSCRHTQQKTGLLQAWQNVEYLLLPQTVGAICHLSQPSFFKIEGFWDTNQLSCILQDHRYRYWNFLSFNQPGMRWPVFHNSAVTSTHPRPECVGIFRFQTTSKE